MLAALMARLASSPGVSELARSVSKRPLGGRNDAALPSAEADGS